jgi:hypothetical protein
MALEELFLKVAMEARKLQAGFGSEKNLSTSLKAFEKTLIRSDDMYIVALKDVHQEELKRISNTLKQSKLPNMRGFLDRVFVQKLAFNMKHVPHGVTLLFEEFIKGTTFFSYQRDPTSTTPIYHRFFSCGIGTELWRKNNMVCLDGLPKSEKNRRRPLIERCYLERQVYDLLYKNEMLHFPRVGPQEPEQDEGHMFRLDLTRQDFETCFKGHNLEVGVKYEDNFPTQLTVVRYKNNKELWKETYTKSFNFTVSGNKVYDAVVECKREVGGKIYMKFQTFDKEVSWHRV